MKILRLSLASAFLAALSFALGPAVAAATNYDLFGDATLITPGNNSNTALQLRSNVTGQTSGGINFAIPAGLTLSGITNLATDFKFTAASCGGGSPRFQINVDGKNIFVYLGPYPSYTLCGLDWASSGNLVTAASIVDTQQLTGGNPYDTWSSALAKYGTHAVTGVQLVTDSSWFFGATQTVLVDNVMVNARTYTFEPAGGGGGGGGGGGNNGDKEKCKKGGWADFTSSPGPFKNQGQCVSHFARAGHHKDHGQDADDESENESDDSD